MVCVRRRMGLGHTKAMLNWQCNQRDMDVSRSNVHHGLWILCPITCAYLHKDVCVCLCELRYIWCRLSAYNDPQVHLVFWRGGTEDDQVKVLIEWYLTIFLFQALMRSCGCRMACRFRAPIQMRAVWKQQVGACEEWSSDDNSKSWVWERSGFLLMEIVCVCHAVLFYHSRHFMFMKMMFRGLRGLWLCL